VTYSTSSLVVGSHVITVTYGGSANFNGSIGLLASNQIVLNQYYIYLPVIQR
jgi:hypothetical protein